MKVNDTVPVTIAGQVVAQAQVEALDDSTATLVFPATRVVMAVRTELTYETPETPDVETIITGVDRPESAPVVEAPTSAPTVDAPVVEAPEATVQETPTAPVVNTEPTITASEGAFLTNE